MKLKKDKNIIKEDKKLKKEKKPMDIKRKMKIIKNIAIICVCLIIFELFIMLIMYFKNESDIKYLDTVNNISLIDNKYYLEAGSSNFRYSKYNDKKVYKFYNKENKKDERIIAEQAKLVKYDLNMNVIWEKTFDCDYDSTYFDAINVSDGIIAVGSYIYKYDQIELRTRDGLIVKYDNDGNIKWFKNYQVLGDTEFYRVIDVSDGLIAIGQSIYENMEIGNHDTGGGIIVKFDYEGNIVWKNNFGGNKSGSFNDIVVVNDGYIVCGKDGSNYGLIAKFDKKGELKWHYNTLHLIETDSLGFNAMELYDNKLYIASSANVSDEKDENNNPIYKFDAAIFVYDLNGKYVGRYKFGSDGEECFNNLIIDDNSIIAIGYTTSKDMFKGIDKQTGIIVKFDLKGKELDKTFFGGLNNDVLTTIIKDKDNNYLIGGYSNSFGNEKDIIVYYKRINSKELDK